MKTLFLTTTALALVLSANIAQAQQITVTGDVSPSTPTPPTWNVGGPLIVGNTGTGTLTIANGGAVTATGTTIANVAGSTGTLNFGVPGGSPTGTLTSPTLVFGAGNGTINFNETDTLTLSAAITGNGTINQIGSGTSILASAQNANVFGGTVNVSNGTLQGGGNYVMGFNANYVVGTNGTLSSGGFVQQIFSLTNAGLVTIESPTSVGLVLATNFYIGQEGTVRMTTFLGGDSVEGSNHLVINSGSATGHSFLEFVNVGGPGVQTTGDGIEVVAAINTATTTAGAFTLKNAELRAGAYDYMLFRGGIVGCATNGLPQARPGDVCQSWYLRSTFINEGGNGNGNGNGNGGNGGGNGNGNGMEPPPPVEPPDVLPPEPPTVGPPTAPGLYPIIGPEIATYGVVQPMAQQLGRSMLGTHDDRLGDAYPVPCEPVAPVYTKAPPLYTKAPTTNCADGWRPAVWGRVFGQQVNNHYLAFADPRADGQIAGLQVGIDVVRSDELIAGHRDYGGFYFAYGNANADVTGLVTNSGATAYVLQHTGAMNLNAYSGGAYWSHYGPQGWYVDLVAQGTSYDGSASTEFASLKTTGSGFIGSGEIGYPIPVPALGFGFVVEPQAQVLWQWIGFDAGNDGLGPVALGTTSETSARVGVKGKWTIATDNGQVWQPYVRANYWQDFGGAANTMFGIDSVPLISKAQYMDVDAGFTTRIDTHFSAFAEAGYQFAVSNEGGGKRDGVRGTAGLRYQW